MKVPLNKNYRFILAFKQNGAVIITQECEEDYFNAYVEQNGKKVVILGEGLELAGTYDGHTLTLLKCYTNMVDCNDPQT